MYNERFSESESINGYIKNTAGIFKLLYQHLTKDNEKKR